YGVTLEMSDGFVDEVVRRSLAQHRRAGGRAPQAVLEPVVNELLFHLPDPGVRRLLLKAEHLEHPERALEEARRQEAAA
ncbi:MAG TPA: ATP-dependent Clp protease ATP-binding subunit ClpX, partial [Oceanithermus profundus]|nr:ATP-dependent Clp protease ATP-binding subunit ClpX [Oceanithermus profundus]